MNSNAQNHTFPTSVAVPPAAIAPSSAAAPTGTNTPLGDDPRLQLLLKSPLHFSFFQAIRNIERSHPELPRVGHASTLWEERFRIRQPADLSFAPSTIDQAIRTEEGIVEVSQRFFGLLGPSGPLPIHLTEIVRNRDRHANDGALQAFLDIFHHRMAALFYRAWSSARPVIQRDRPPQDRFAAYLGSLSGNGTLHSRGRDAWEDDSKNYFAGQLGGLHRNAEGLVAMLESVLNVSICVQPFSLRWLPLSRRERTRLVSTALGSSPSSASNLLGSSTVLGERVPDRQGSIEVRLGPMSYPDFDALMPNSPKREKLKAVVRTHAGSSMVACFRPVLRKEEIPRPQLGSIGHLGRNTWIQSKPLTNDRDDFCFTTSDSPFATTDLTTRKAAA